MLIKIGTLGLSGMSIYYGALLAKPFVEVATVYLPLVPTMGLMMLLVGALVGFLTLVTLGRDVDNWSSKRFPYLFPKRVAGSTQQTTDWVGYNLQVQQNLQMQEQNRILQRGLDIEKQRWMFQQMDRNNQNDNPRHDNLNMRK